MNWYQKLASSVSEVNDNIDSVLKDIQKIQGVNSIYIFGSYKENLNNPEAKVRDVDIILDTKFNSEDLLMIDNGMDTPLKIRPDMLEDLGYEPTTVRFTKQLLSYNKCKLDNWLITEDKKVLHWGNAPDTIEDWHDIKAYAETNTAKQTGLNRKQACKSPDDLSHNWFSTYQNNFNKRLKVKKSMGWYLTDSTSEEILSNSLKW